MPAFASDVFLAGVVVLLTSVWAAAALDAQALERTLEPAWSWQVQPGLEWVELVGRGDAAALLVVTRDARLHLIDPSTGKPRLSEPLAVGRGVRPAVGHNTEEPRATTAGDSRAADAPTPSNVAYCFDRHAAYAVRLSAPAGLKWQSGQRPANAEEFQGDPEVLKSWFAAQATPTGLLLAGTDGRLLLLSHVDGSVRWSIALPDLPVARLRVLGSTAVVVWKARGEVKAAFIKLGEERPKPTIRALGDAWPLWSRLTPEGLLTLSRTRVTLWPERGPPRRFSIEASDLQAATVDVFVPPAPAATAMSPSPSQAALLLVGAGPGPSAYDLSTGRKVWPSDNALGSEVPIDSPARCRCHTLRVHGDRFVCATQLGATVYDAATGTVVGYCKRDSPAELVAAELRGRRLYAVYRNRLGARTDSRAGVTEAAFHLVRVRLPSSTTSRPADSRSKPATFHLKGAGALRQVVWTGERVVLVAQDGLWAYTLP